MSEASSRLMLIDAEHLRVVNEQNVHLVRWPNDPEHVERAVRESAVALGYHVAHLDGRTLRTEADVLSALTDAFQFPRSAGEMTIPSWKGAADYLGDLNWLFAPASPSKGAVAFLREPETLMQSDPLQLAFVVQELAVRSQQVLRRGIPFCVVIGPLPESYGCEHFLGCLTAAEHFCEPCVRTDPREILDPGSYYVDCR